MTFMLKQNYRECSSFGTLVHCSCTSRSHLEVSQGRSRLREHRWAAVEVSSHCGIRELPLLFFLSALIQDFVSLGMVWMWPAMNLSLECRLLSTVWPCWRWGSCPGLLDPALVCLHSAGRSWEQGTWKVLTFKIHFVTLVNKKWQTDESWEKMTHSCEDSRNNSGLAQWPRAPKHHGVDQKLCYWMAGLALQFFELEAASGKRGHWLPGSLFHACHFGSVSHAQNSDKPRHSLCYIPISLELLHS